MAVVKIHQIKADLKAAIKYITNPAKTDEGRLITSNIPRGATDYQTITTEFERLQAYAEMMRKAGKPGTIKAHHLMQSFKPGEVTPEQAHDLGIEFIEQITDSKYEYVIATHQDKDHIHNHIMWNPVHIYELMRYRTVKTSLAGFREISDEVCRRAGLSVITTEPTKDIERTQPGVGEVFARARGASTKEDLRNLIDAHVAQATSLPELIARLRESGVESKTVRSALLFRDRETMQRWVRAHRLGPSYAEESLIARLGRSSVTKYSVGRPSVTIINADIAHVHVPGMTPTRYLVVDREHLIDHGKTWHFYLNTNTTHTLVDRSGTFANSLTTNQLYAYYDKPRPELGLGTRPYHERIRRGRTAGERRYYALVDYKVDTLHKDIALVNMDLKLSRMTPSEQRDYIETLRESLRSLGHERQSELVTQQRLADRIQAGTSMPEHDQLAKRATARIDTLSDEIDKVMDELGKAKHVQEQQRKGPRL